MSTPKKGDLQVWWIPQVPMKAFNMAVENVDDACLLLVTLAEYDIFQYENNIKPDYSNAGGLCVFEDGEWVDWYDDEKNEDINERLTRKYQS